MTSEREILSTVPTTHNPIPGEISLLARQLWAESHGWLTLREAIDRARAIVLARRGHAADCAVRALGLAVNAESEADAARFTESAVRFLSVAMREAA